MAEREQSTQRREEADPPYGYDIREASKVYASTIGTVGGFAITAVVLVFTVRPARSPNSSVLLAYTVGLLVLGLIGCLIGSFVFAALGAERRLTPNLPAAALYAGSSCAIGVVSILAAFEGLASLYLPAAKSLFALTTLGVQLGAVVLVALVLGDAWTASSPLAPSYTQKHWLGTQTKGAKAGSLAAAATATSVVLGGILYFCQIRLSLNLVGVHILIGAGLFLTVGTALAGTLRTLHNKRLHSLGLPRVEACIVLAALAAFMMFIMLTMP